MNGEQLLPLTLEEQKLLLALREIPPSRLRDLMTALVSELADFVAEPRCTEMQADGVPCPHVGVSCELCGRSVQWVRDLREAIARSST